MKWGQHTHSIQWLIFTFRGTTRDLDDQNTVILCKKNKQGWTGWRKCGEGKSKEKIKEAVMDSRRTWEGLETAADSPVHCHQIEAQTAKMWLYQWRQRDICFLLVWPCDTRAQMLRRWKYSVKVGAQELLPFGGKCDASAPGLQERVKHNRSTAAPDQQLLENKNRLLLPTFVISGEERRHIAARLAFLPFSFTYVS